MYTLLNILITMTNFSTTQATNIASIAGLLVVILAHFHISIGTDDLTTLIGALVTAGGIITNYIHRYQRGDLTIVGARKV